MQIVGGETFKTQKDLIQRIRQIRDSVRICEDIKGEEADFLSELFRRHDDYEEKSGEGIVRIFVDYESVYNTKCFYVERTDGSIVDISYMSCLSAKKETDLRKFTEACRNAIKGQIDAFRSAIVYPIKCPYTGKELLNDRETHIDHAPPYTFKRIRDTFIDEYGVDLKKVTYLTGVNVGTYFDDLKIEPTFRAYHRIKAHLRAVSKEANLNHIKQEAKQYD